MTKWAQIQSQPPSPEAKTNLNIYIILLDSVTFKVFLIQRFSKDVINCCTDHYAEPP